MAQRTAEPPFWHRVSGFRIAILAFLPLLSVSTSAATRYRAPDGAFAALERPLAVGARVTLHNLPLASGKSSDVDLERCEVWQPDAKITLYTDHGVEHFDPSPVLTYRGAVAGDPDSLVVLTKSNYGIHGFV